MPLRRPESGLELAGGRGGGGGGCGGGRDDGRARGLGRRRTFTPSDEAAL